MEQRAESPWVEPIGGISMKQKVVVYYDEQLDRHFFGYLLFHPLDAYQMEDGRLKRQHGSPVKKTYTEIKRDLQTMRANIEQQIREHIEHQRELRQTHGTDD